MHIVHVISSLDPAQGGPPAVAENLAKAQIALGHEVRLAIESGVGSRDVVTVNLPRHSMLRLFTRPVPEIAKLVASADVLHLHGVWEPLLVAVANAARAASRPFVITPHGMLDPWSLAQGRWKKWLALSMGFRSMLNSASALHALNTDERDLMASLKLRPLCEVIPNGIFLDEIESLPTCAPDRRYVLFLGRLHYKKGLDLLAGAFAEVAKRHSDVDLVVVGPDGGEEQSFRQHIERLGLSNRVRLTGPVYGKEKWSALAGAAVFCLPSRQEGFSVAILEAMACRVPVVISEQCHFPEVAEAAAGRIVPLAASNIAAALDAIFDDPNAKATMGDAGRRLVEERFTWPQAARQTLAMYGRIHKSAAAR